MDKAHHKELQKNDLEVGLEKVASSVRPYYAPLALVAAILIVGAIGYMIYERNVRATNAAAWTKWSLAVFDRDPDSEVLRKVGEELGDTPASLWATQLAADEDLREGSYLIYNDREGAQDKLEAANELYQKVIKGAGSDLMLLTRARYGAARTNECLFKVDNAIELYQQIVNSEMSKSALATAAKERIELLKKPETKDWYKWYATQEPYKPLPNRNPNSKGGLNSFPGGAGVPEIPGGSIPTIDGVAPSSTDKNGPAPTEGEKKPATEEKTPSADREEKPSRFEEKPSAEPKPGEPKSGEETPKADAPPATPDTPSTEKPAGEKPAAEPAAEPKPEEKKP